MFPGIAGRFLCAALLAPLLASVGQTYCQAANWKPDYVTEVFKAPPPDNLEARQKAFAERDSPENIQKLGEQFFSLIYGGYMNQAIRDAIHTKKDMRAALDAYRDVFVDRLRFPPACWAFGFGGDQWRWPMLPRYPGGRPGAQSAGERYLVPFFHTPEDLMTNVVGLYLPDQEGKKAQVRIDIGAPGRVNWTWQPAGFKDPGFYILPGASLVGAYSGHPSIFYPLWQEYLKTENPIYMQKWAEFEDDRYLNWRADCAKAGFVRVGFNDIEYYTREVFPALAYLARATPHFEKVISGPTLARILLRTWTMYAPRCLQAMRESGGNRRTGIYGTHLLMMAMMNYDALPAKYWLQEYRRVLEDSPVVTVMPDGGMIENTVGYFYTYISQPARAWYALRMMYPYPAWLTTQWRDELFENINLVNSFLVRNLLNPGWLPPNNAGGTEHWRMDYLWSAAVELVPPPSNPDNLRIWQTVFGEGDPATPRYESEAFPYTGIYFLRNGWTKQDQCLNMASSRPTENGDNQFANNITLFACGQQMLYYGWDTPIMVDGCPQAGRGQNPRLAYPEKYRRNRGEFKYGFPLPSPTAWQTVLTNRFHDSARFAMCEGVYSGAFMKDAPSTNHPATFIDDVTHHRQVLLLKKPGLWLVTDRLRGKRPHEYTLCWTLEPPRQWQDSHGAISTPGFNDEQVRMDNRAQTISAENSNAVHLSIRHISSIPLKLDKYSWRSGASERQYGGSFQAPGNALLISALYPWSGAAPDLAPLKKPDNAPAGQSFQAALPDGTKVYYEAAQDEGTFKAGNVTARGQGLLLITGSKGEAAGLVLGCKEFSVGWWRQKVAFSDFEFELVNGKLGQVTPIYKSMDRVEIFPQADCFSQPIEISMTAPEPDVEIRYTLDGLDPDVHSLLYTAPFKLGRTATVKARAFRKGLQETPPTFSATHMSAVSRAVYTMAQPWEAPKTPVTTPGLKFAYYEETPQLELSAPVLEGMATPVKQGTTPELFDISARQTTGVYAFVYSGYLDIPRDGVYSIHAPREWCLPNFRCGYELRVFLGEGNQRKEWYPATRWHNFGAWSLPLTKGKYPFKVVWVDSRARDLFEQYVPGWRDALWDGVKPTLEISGPGLNKQPIPAGMLCH